MVPWIGWTKPRAKKRLCLEHQRASPVKQIHINLLQDSFHVGPVTSELFRDFLRLPAVVVFPNENLLVSFRQMSQDLQNRRCHFFAQVASCQSINSSH